MKSEDTTQASVCASLWFNIGSGATLSKEATVSGRLVSEKTSDCVNLESRALREGGLKERGTTGAGRPKITELFKFINTSCVFMDEARLVLENKITGVPVRNCVAPHH